MPPGYFPSVIPLEPAGIVNSPHSGSPEDARICQQRQHRPAERPSSPQRFRYSAPTARKAAPSRRRHASAAAERHRTAIAPWTPARRRLRSWWLRRSGRGQRHFRSSVNSPVGPRCSPTKRQYPENPPNPTQRHAIAAPPKPPSPAASKPPLSRTPARTPSPPPHR